MLLLFVCLINEGRIISNPTDTYIELVENRGMDNIEKITWKLSRYFTFLKSFLFSFLLPRPPTWNQKFIRFVKGLPCEVHWESNDEKGN